MNVQHNLRGVARATVEAVSAWALASIEDAGGDRRSWPDRRPGALAEPRPGRNRGRRRRSAELTRARRGPGRLSTGVLDDLQRAGSAHNLGLGRGDRWSWPGRRPGLRRSAELARSSPWGAGRTSTRARSRTPAIGGAGQVVALGRWQNLDQGAIEDGGDRRSWPGRRPGALAGSRPASWRACSAPAQITTST